MRLPVQLIVAVLAVLALTGSAGVTPAADAKPRCAQAADGLKRDRGQTRCGRRQSCAERVRARARAARRKGKIRRPRSARVELRRCLARRKGSGRKAPAAPQRIPPALPLPTTPDQPPAEGIGDLLDLGELPVGDLTPVARPPVDLRPTDPPPVEPPSVDPPPVEPPSVDPPPVDPPPVDPPPVDPPPVDPPPVDLSVGDVRFSPGSVWDARLPATAPIDSQSHARLDAMLDHVEALAAKYFYPSLAIGSYSTPIYVVPKGQPRVPVSLGTWSLPLKRALAAGVPIPSNAQPAAGTDAHMTIYQPSTDSMWEFWKMEKRTAGWHAGWGGAMRPVSQSPGYYDNGAWPGLEVDEGFNWGSTATSLPVAGGTITMQELREGRIDHALAASVPFACRDFFVYPAQRTDGGSVRADCMPEGARLRLHPDLDIDALTMPAVTKVIARAAQDYGIVVRDKTGGQSISLFAEQVPAGEPNVYLGEDGLLGGVPPWSVLRRFPWRKLQLVEAPACQSAPCLPSS